MSTLKGEMAMPTTINIVSEIRVENLDDVQRIAFALNQALHQERKLTVTIYETTTHPTPKTDEDLRRLLAN